MYSAANGQHFKAGPGMLTAKRHIKWQQDGQRREETESERGAESERARQADSFDCLRSCNNCANVNRIAAALGLVCPTGGQSGELPGLPGLPVLPVVYLTN